MANGMTIKVYVSQETGIKTNVVTGARGPIGEKGDKGDTGLGFKIAKTYSSIAALEADTTPTGILAGEFAIITIAPVDGVQNPDNGRLYLWNGTIYIYTVNISVQGIYLNEIDGGNFPTT